MLARDVMSTPVIAVLADASVTDVAAVLVANRISAVPVLEQDGLLVGIISESDLFQRPEVGSDVPRSWLASLMETEDQAAIRLTRTLGTHARDVMTSSVVCVDEASDLRAVSRLLEQHKIKRVVVTSEGRAVGIVSRSDLIRVLALAGLSERAAPTSDEAIRTSILDRLSEAGIRSTYVSVLVHDGIVSLWGMVKSASIRNGIRAAAESVTGVRKVEDNLTVDIMPSSAM